MLTRPVCQPPPKARSLQTRAAACGALRPTGNSLLRAGTNQQIRSFRFGMWSSYLDPELQKEIRHRQRVLKHKCVAALHEKLSWDQRSIDGSPKVILKHMLRRYWSPTGPRCGSRFVDHDELNDRRQQSRVTPDTGNVRMKTPWGPNSYASWMSNYGDYMRYSSTRSWKSRLDEAMDHWGDKASKPAAQADSHVHPPESAGAEHNLAKEQEHDFGVSSSEEYTIDPITMRKIPKRFDEQAIDTTSSPTNSFKSYRAQFSAFAPPKDGENLGPTYSDGPPSPIELKEYGQIKIDEIPSHGASGGHDGIQALGDNVESPRYPVIQSEEYQAYQRDELDERAPEPTKNYEDLDKYKTYGAKEAENPSAEAPQVYEDLHEYKPYIHNENTETEKHTERYDDLGQYGPYKYQEGAARDIPSTEYDDLHKYKHYKEDSVKPVDDSAPKYDDLNKYDTKTFQDPAPEEQPFQQYGDLEQYRIFRSQELDNAVTPERDIVAESLEEFDAKAPEPTLDKNPTSSILDGLQKLGLNDASQFSSAQEGHQSPATETEPRPSQTGLTGNYLRDFPEDFSGSWSTSDGKTAYIQEAEKQYSDELSESTNSKKLETSLERQQTEPKLEAGPNQPEVRSTRRMFDHYRAQAEVDPYSKEPQGLETSYTRECDGEQTPLTFAKTYGGDSREAVLESLSAEDASQRILDLKPLYFRDPEVDGRPPISSSESDTMPEPNRTTEPTVYKILAYDPTMQKINIAETTSVVPDQASPLSPAEVLLRLSNPTKFFPHFTPLQAEGFEIVSGNGDVLVFRQVRPLKVTGHGGASPVNPIDMMGKPAALPNAAAFVSPTGFVNYDVPQAEEEAQAPAFRSNIDVRREEPVFSGPKSTAREEARTHPKDGVGKRVLIGGAWVAGISYALGVVSEYFITGGTDGRGPTSF
ncbi:hypothetical protein F4813DRAFT_358162 [Daldinia decipiens]|uniref:uncharacterized protein n=1 Tax=Daldinia decipiens TaxID=326647 RepID=UPI0020C53B8C|nr:uncharacterized protein F4813DRAFT_358162 [Daldinia decipiens]KAI1657850.1 hypothetical protein F4813DRAFT_358162 [Daldinia decipiens]